jgi:transcriptional regulator with XRE-family HTH domain
MGRIASQSTAAPNRRRGPGERLRALRLVVGFSLRDVHRQSIAISRRLQNRGFLLPASRLHEIETRDVIPSVHRLYTLACVYGCRLNEILHWYGVPQVPIRKRSSGSGFPGARA